MIVGNYMGYPPSHKSKSPIGSVINLKKADVLHRVITQSEQYFLSMPEKHVDFSQPGTSWHQFFHVFPCFFFSGSHWRAVFMSSLQRQANGNAVAIYDYDLQLTSKSPKATWKNHRKSEAARRRFNELMNKNHCWSRYFKMEVSLTIDNRYNYNAIILTSV